MSNAGHDQNGRPTIICASKNDGTTIVPILASASTHSLMTQDGTGQTNNGNNGGNAMEDENGVVVWTALSSANNGAIIEVYGDPTTGAVLISNI